MEKLLINFTPKQVESLRELKKNTGLTVSDIVRRAVDQYLKKEDILKPHICSCFTPNGYHEEDCIYWAYYQVFNPGKPLYSREKSS